MVEARGWGSTSPSQICVASCHGGVGVIDATPRSGNAAARVGISLGMQRTE
jgi:hypothetical protein